MKQHILLLTAFLGLSSTIFYGRELRTPLSVLFTPAHYPYPLDTKDRDWDVQIQGIPYQRVAYNAFTHDEGTNTTNYSALYFGQENFLGQQVFPNAAIARPTNPWLNFSTMMPRVTYNENGVLFNVIADKRFCDDSWCAGVRVQIPFRMMEIKRVKACESTYDDLGSNDINQFVAQKVENFQALNGTTYSTITYAYRLDFLSRLNFDVTADSPLYPFVKYADPIYANHVTVATVDASNEVNGGGMTVAYPLFVIKTNGSVPTGNFSDYENEIILQGTGLPTALNPDGSGLSNNQRGYFNRATNYAQLGNNPSAQSTLWLVPGIEQGANSIGITPEAEVIRSSLTNLLAIMEQSSEEFFIKNGICFADYRRMGLGDIETDLFLFHQMSCRTWIEAMLGIRYPTGKKLKNANEVYAQSLGNNGHYEVRFGAQAGLDALSWLNLKADGYYYWVTEATEKVAAPFAGATIKNVGPTIDAAISWHYFIGHIDMTFINRCDNPLGCNIGYEFYHKGKDKIILANSFATDFTGAYQPLDPKVLSKYTKEIVHKIRTELFFQGDMFEVFSGFTHAVAGKNAPQETDIYLGLTISF